MKNISIIGRTFALFVIISFTIWLGSYFARLLVIYQLFDSETLQLKAIYEISSLNQVFYSVLPLLLTNIVAYLSFLLFFILFVLISKISLKQNGWLFIILLIVLITAPFEVFLVYKDYTASRLILAVNPDPQQILHIIKDRMIVLNSFSLIEVFSFIAVIHLALFQPLQKINEN